MGGGRAALKAAEGQAESIGEVPSLVLGTAMRYRIFFRLGTGIGEFPFLVLETVFSFRFAGTWKSGSARLLVCFLFYPVRCHAMKLASIFCRNNF